MEKPLYPSSYMRITQGYNIGSHIDSYAIDEGGKDQNISTLKAPFTGIIKKIYPQDANEVWLESVEPVEYPDGTIDYMTIMLAHANDVSNLFVGKRIEKGEEFYKEGTKGQATGNHCHIECGKGKFTGTGWYKNKNGNYSINNGKRPEECLWIDDTITILNNNGYNFKKIVTTNIPVDIPTEIPQQEIPEDEGVEQETPENNQSKINLVYVCPKKGLYGIYLNEKDELYLKENKSA